MKFWKATALPMNENRMETYFSIRYEFDRERVFQRMDRGAPFRREGIHLRGGRPRTFRGAAQPGIPEGAGRSPTDHCDSGWVPVYLKWLLHADRPQYCGAQIFHDVIAMKKYRMMFLGELATRWTPCAGPWCGRIPAWDTCLLRNCLSALRMSLITAPLRRGSMNTCRTLSDFTGRPQAGGIHEQAVPPSSAGNYGSLGRRFHFAAGGRIRRAPDWMVACKLNFSTAFSMNRESK